jgi:nucleoside-diphosphate-sugar epimerase
LRALVTGAAGFIGSHLVDRLLSDGNQVVAIDCLSDYYSMETKRENLAGVMGSPGFKFLEGDLQELELEAILRDVDVVFHQAGQPGVRRSWAAEFDSYVRNNVLATQRLLEAARGSSIERLVYASSSSIYGDAAGYPTAETAVPAPRSPYGVTKLAAEHLCALYAATWDVSTVSLRYFTVYGSRQRPDMATHRLIEAAFSGDTFSVYGDGRQIRDFTHVRDVVSANLAAARASVEPGAVMNVAGGSSTTLLELASLVESLTDRELKLRFEPRQPGDVHRTGADTSRASELIHWKPTVGLSEGVAEQVAWHQARLGDH